MTPAPVGLKAVLRKVVQRRRRTLDPSWCGAASAQLIEHLRGSAAWQQAATIAAFAPMLGEPDLTALLQPENGSGKRVTLPRVTEAGLSFFLADFDRLVPGAFGVREPAPSARVISPNAIDLFLVPGVLFDRQGGRLGMGKGLYDKVLSEISAPRIGVTWEWQIVAEVPREPHDVAMSALCTEIAMHKPAVPAAPFGHGRIR